MNKIENNDLHLLIFDEIELETSYEKKFLEIYSNIFTVLYDTIQKTNQTSDFNLIYKHVEVTLKKSIGLFKQIEKNFFGITSGKTDQNLIKYNWETEKEKMDEMFMQHLAQLSLGKRDVLLKFAENAKDKQEKYFFQEALDIHLENLQKQGLHKTPLWRVKSDEKTVAYLYPVVHLISGEIEDCPEFLKNAMEECSLFALEQANQFSNKEEIEEDLGPWIFNTDSWRKFTKIDYDKIEIIGKPRPLAQKGFEKLTSFSTEKCIANIFHKAGKPISNLECPETHVFRGLLVDMVDKLITSIKFNISGMSDSQERSIMVVEDWLIGGDIEKIYQESLSFNQKKATVLEETFGPLNYSVIGEIKRSNREMAISIDRLIQDSQVPFAAIGASHFGGDDGMIRLLEKRGYTIEKVN